MARNSNLIYFNNNRSTPLDESVSRTMSAYGEEAPADDKTLDKTKAQLAEMIGAMPEEIFLTSGTTESVELGMKSMFALHKGRGKHIITQVTEHPVVLNCCKDLEAQGAEISYLKVDREGLVDPDEFGSAIKPGTILLSLMAANNETGVLQPVEQLSAICRQHQVLFLSDGSQVAGKLRCDVSELGMDCLAFGAHKMHGPKDIGALFVSSRCQELAKLVKENLHPRLTAAQVAGFGQAAEVFYRNHWEIGTHVSRLKNYFEHQLLEIEGLRINGSTRHRLYNTSNLCIPQAEKVIELMDRFDFAGNRKTPSYVLKAMGLSEEENRNSFRFSFGKQNTLEEVKLLVKEILELAGKPFIAS